MAEQKVAQERKFSQEQYDMLKRCSDAKDTSEWNDWRDENSNKPVLLEGADFKGKWLKCVNFEEAYLNGANFRVAKVQQARFYEAKLKKAKFHKAQLQLANFDGATLFGAGFLLADMENSSFMGALLAGANFRQAHLEGASFIEAKLENTSFFEAYLDGCWFSDANLEGASFKHAMLNGKTRIANCSINKITDFSGVGLDSATIDPELKAAFKDNIRRIKWQQWFCQGNWFQKIFKNIFVRPFWWVTDYGSSTSRIVYAFLALVIIFAGIYFAFETISGWQGIVQNLRIDGNPGYWHVAWRALYFSVVTMTTLGFGDMHATKSADLWGFLGCVFLSLQVIAGYVLLGALVTRLGILFTSEAPAAKQAPIKLKDKQSD